MPYLKNGLWVPHITEEVLRQHQKPQQQKKEDPAREAKREAKRLERKERRQQERAEPAWKAARFQAKDLREQEKERKSRLYQSLVGTSRRFRGEIILPPNEANVMHAPDVVLTSDVSNLDKAAIFWTDGCHVTKKGVAEEGCMGAGVVWLTKETPTKIWTNTACAISTSPSVFPGWELSKRRYLLGRHTGSIGDAEHFAMTAALGIAVQEVESGTREIERVRIYTDRKGLLQCLASNNPSHMPLGPMMGPRLAIQDFYDWSDWLVDRGIRVELAWVKGHQASRGNKAAHQNAETAAREQAQAFPGDYTATLKMAHDVPLNIMNAGEDFAAEWLWRANKTQLVSKGIVTNVYESTRETDERALEKLAAE
ncbi:hypothetical protein CC80DRAFT_591468 [Byssothecium circinans]|uniref:RNase H type-1 domain-containing protein n=1 Tax=Byssothecium circinans TaxID=147558 RepID=A0A6A5U432_9PLEO|nr:hypothetical protein CC80DRAFT_591468 [Byssothecium circinans]